MRASEYWEEYMKAVEAGESRKKFAERVGLTPQAVWTKTYDKRRMGYDIPQLPTERGNLPHSEFAEIMERHGIKRKDGSKKKPGPKSRKAEIPMGQGKTVALTPKEEADNEDDLPDEILDIIRGATN